MSSEIVITAEFSVLTTLDVDKPTDEPPGAASNLNIDGTTVVR